MVRVPVPIRRPMLLTRHSLSLVVGRLDNSIVGLVRHPQAFPCTNGSPTDSLNVDDHNEIILLLVHLLWDNHWVTSSPPWSCSCWWWCSSRGRRPTCPWSCHCACPPSICYLSLPSAILSLLTWKKKHSLWKLENPWIALLMVLGLGWEVVKIREVVKNGTNLRHLQLSVGPP